MMADFNQYNNPNAPTIWIWQGRNGAFVQSVAAETKEEALSRIGWECGYDSVEAFLEETRGLDSFEEFLQDPDQRLVKEDALSLYAVYSPRHSLLEENDFVRTVRAKGAADAVKVFAWTQGARDLDARDGIEVEKVER